ncbi:hypothetical protein [Agrobacterium salinitolerans]|uniref:hypothetical protein n=1 Tax=Agrobacterium salinitolerans TaxID=1183413 RepID=UPI001574945F|nr:hypothetical protein [Agrobacterium salinitolerans]NTA39849.1 hypothetical protein [Agrobacterium salinitolerans]
MKITTIFIAAGAALLLAGCQTAKPLSPEQQAKQDEYNRENDRVAKADCGLVDLLNQRRTKVDEKPLHAPDCAYMRRNNTLVGFDGRPTPLPNFAFNGIPVPIGGVVALAQAAEKATNEERAKKAQIPAHLKSEDGAIVYRKMILRGFKESEVAAVADSGAFSHAAVATGRGRQYLASAAR